MTAPPKRLLFLVNTDDFFVSHRLKLGVAAKAAGYEVFVAAHPTGGAEAIRAAGLESLPLPITPGGTNPAQELQTLIAITQLMRKIKPDVVHNVTIKPVLYGSLLRRVLGNLPTINAISGLGYVFTPRDRPSLRHSALKAGIKLLYRGAFGGSGTRVIFQNRTDRAFFLTAGLLPESHARLIEGSGVDLDYFQATPLPSGPLTYLLPGRMLGDKGVREFVAAGKLVRKQVPECRLLLVGSNESTNPSRISSAEIRKWESEGLVEWLGYQTDMRSWLQRSHVVVLPSYREGLSLALIEACAAGRACITSDVPGCRDVIEHGQNGWTVPPRNAHALAEAMITAASDRQELALRGQRGRAIAEKRFGNERITTATIDLYRELAPLREALSNMCHFLPSFLLFLSPQGHGAQTPHLA